MQLSHTVLGKVILIHSSSFRKKIQDFNLGWDCTSKENDAIAFPLKTFLENILQKRKAYNFSHGIYHIFSLSLHSFVFLF